MKPSSRSAFTLVEVLVVIAITALLAGLILTYSSTSRDQVALYVEQAKLAQTIAKAKSLTISTYNQPTVPCGYGVHINYGGKEADTYTLFSYAPAKSKPECNITSLEANRMEEITTERLQSNLTFGKPKSKAEDILFLPPNPDTWIWLYEDSSTSTAGQVPLASKSGKLSVQVSISSAGQITFSK